MMDNFRDQLEEKKQQVETVKTLEEAKAQVETGKALVEAKAQSTSIPDGKTKMACQVPTKGDRCVNFSLV